MQDVAHQRQPDIHSYGYRDASEPEMPEIDLKADSAKKPIAKLLLHRQDRKYRPRLIVQCREQSSGWKKDPPRIMGTSCAFA
jgi:hypothetical protein